MKLTYQAYDNNGKSVFDTIDAGNAADAKEQLRRRGLFVTKIDRVSDGPVSKGDRAKRSRNRAREDAGPSRAQPIPGRRQKQVVMFARQLYVLVSSGTRIVEALESFEQQIREDAWRKVVADVRRRVEEGSSLSEAVAAHPKYFDPISQNLIAAGEATGKLPEMLDRLSKLIQRQVQIKSTLAGAMVYPTLLMVISVGVMVVMLMFVLPRFTVMFASLDTPLPPTTKMLVHMSDLLRAYWWALLGGLILGGFGLWAWSRSVSGKRAIDTVVLRIPQVGRMTRNFATAKIARLLGILLDSYMPLLEVLGLIRRTVGNSHYVSLIEDAEDAVTRGEAISTAFIDSDLVNPTVCQVVRAGEQSGQVAPLLLNIAEIMDEENEVIVKSLTSLLEPLILVGLGGMVGFVAMSMFLPLFDLMGGAGGGGGG